MDFEDLKRLGIVLKRARFFITCKGKTMPGVDLRPQSVLKALVSGKEVILSRAPAALAVRTNSGRFGKSLSGQL